MTELFIPILYNVVCCKAVYVVTAFVIWDKLPIALKSSETLSTVLSAKLFAVHL